MKVLINAPFSQGSISFIEQNNSGCEFLTQKDYDRAEVIIGSIVDEKIPQELKLLQSTNAGVEKLCQKIPGSIVLTNVSGAFGDVISEYVTGQILSNFRCFSEYKSNQTRRVWQDLKKERLIYGSKTLILGCGDVGTAIAKRLSVFGASIVGIRRSPAELPCFDAVYGTEKLDELLPHADIVICTLPLTPGTRGLMNAQRLSLLKENSLLINVGRGAVFDENALVNQLCEGRFSAVLDVFAAEPLSENSPLWELPNVTITPHISGCSFGHSAHTERLIAEICSYNLNAFVNNLPLKNVIDTIRGY